MTEPFPTRTEVLVVGGGNAALCAAIEAREAGAEVLLCEHAGAAMRGGNTRHTRNLRAMHDAPTAVLTDAYTEDEYWNDLVRVTEGDINEPLARLVVRESAGIADWMTARGVHFQRALSGTLSLGRTNAFFLGGGQALLNALYRHAEGIGVRMCYDTEVRSLDIEAGRCRAARVINRGFEYAVETGAVVLAAGGFQANAEWMREAWGPAADNFLIRGTPYNRGRMLRELMDKGALVTGDPSQCHAVAIDARAPRYDGGIVTRLDCVCFSIVVNGNGERFYDEGEDFWPKRYAIWGRLVAAQPNQVAWAIIDAQVADQFMPSVFPSISAPTLAGLAALIGIDDAALMQTVDTFNASVQPGTYDPAVLDDCHTGGISPPKSHWALPLTEPPFAAYPLRPGITFTYLAAAVDETARVQRAEGGRMANVWAAGEIMAGNILGRGYCAGTGMTIGSVFGRIAGREAACHQ